MARIPLQVASRSLDTGNVVSYPSGSPVGGALEGFGNALQGAAERVKARDEQKDSFDATIRENELTASLAQLEDEAVQNAPADSSGVHDSVYGQIDPVSQQAVKPGSYDKLFDDYLQRVPESKRAEFAAKKELYRLRGSARLAQQQYAGEQSYYKVEIQKTQNQITNAMAMADPSDSATFDQFKKQGIDIIEKSGLPALEKDVAKTNWLANADETLFKTLLAKDPEFANKAKAALGLAPAESAPDVSGGDSVNVVVSKIIGVESGGNPTAKNPNSSARGLGQFIDSTWLATIRAHRPDIAAGKSAQEILALKTNAPLARQMTEALTRDNAGYLRNRGVQTTPGNLYLAHFLGPAGAVQTLKANPSASIASIVGQDAMRANSFLAGKSAADVIAWAAKKMGGPAPEADPRFANIPLDRRLVLANQADSVAADRRVEQRGDIEIAMANAPLAIQMTGQYTGQMPSQQQFIGAYGEQQGAEKFSQFQAAVETSSRVHEMQTMPASSIEALVAEAAPTSSGNDIAAQNERYQVLAKAADATVKAREADPAAYVQRAFPTVAGAWQNATDPAGMQRAIAATVAAQQQLGINNIAPLPKEIAGDAVVKFKDATLGETERFAAVTDIFLATPDPTQRKAIFEQMVEAGLPDVTDGAFVALDRGDTGAARRLFQAAMTDISKLPGQSPVKPVDIDEAIERLIMADEQIGDIYYGMADGAIENIERAQRDSKLLANAVNIRVRNGEPLDAAVSSVAKDLYGDVKPVLGDGRTGAQILIPNDADEDKVMDGLAGLMPAIEERLRQALTVPDDAPAADGTRAIMNAASQNEVNALLGEGYFRNIANGYMFFLPRLGAVAGDDGEPLIFTMDDILAAGVKKPRDVRTPDAPLTDDDFDAFQKRMQQ